ncbi:MAG: M50 family metallopeptidase [Deltaproteobacteria bacterium]|nr:M50 family metallopeptidase [Deltaproteobacteria bacterium]
MNPRVALIIASIFSLVIIFLPYGGIVGYPLLLLSTIVHEMGHGIAGLIVGYNFHSFNLYADGSGAALISGSGGRLSQAVTSAGGLVGPAFTAAVFFPLAARPRLARAALVLVAVFFLLTCIIWVRNIFGFTFIAAIGVLLLFISIKANNSVNQFALALLAVQLTISVFVRADYLFTKVAMTSKGAMPSDVAQIQAALILPYWFWGLVCGAISVAVLILGLRSFWRNSRVVIKNNSNG